MGPWTKWVATSRPQRNVGSRLTAVSLQKERETASWRQRAGKGKPRRTGSIKLAAAGRRHGAGGSEPAEPSEPQGAGSGEREPIPSSENGESGAQAEPHEKKIRYGGTCGVVVPRGASIAEKRRGREEGDRVQSLNQEPAGKAQGRLHKSNQTQSGFGERQRLRKHPRSQRAEPERGRIGSERGPLKETHPYTEAD